MSDNGLKKIAFMACYFPPFGGGGTPRSVAFCKHLPRHGYVPQVFMSVPDEKAYTREFQRDESRVYDCNQSQVFKVSARSLVSRINSKLLTKSLRPYFWFAAYPFIYETMRPWAFSAAKKVIDLHASESYRLIYASAGPYCTLEAASFAARRLKIPWIADLRDLWTCDSLRFYPSRLHYLWESSLERKVLRTASAVIANTPLSGEIMKEFLGRDAASRVVVIPNGYDAEAISSCSGQSDSGKQPGKLKILHAGTLYAPGVRKSRPGRYFPVPINDTARSLMPVANGLLELSKIDREAFEQVQIIQVGFSPPSLKLAIESLDLPQGKIIFEGVVSRDKALEYSNNADALLAVQMAWQDPAKPVPYVPGKVYDYIATGKPILAPIAPGDLYDLLSGHVPQAYVCNYSDPVEIAKTISRMTGDIKMGRVGACDRVWKETYSRESQTQCLARLCDNILTKCYISH